jgi:hypothetical protein
LEIIRRLAEHPLAETGGNPSRWRELVAASQDEYRAFRAGRLDEQTRRLSRLR